MTQTPEHPATPASADPSMEDILASIRRILNEESPPQPKIEAPAEDDVLVLDRSMMVSSGETKAEAVVAMSEPQPPVSQGEPPHRDTEVVTPPRETNMGGLPALTPELVAPEAAAAAASSVSSLMRTLATGRATQVYSGGPTLEDMVRAELRPLMKEWLDTHLPPLVERLVRVEIERVVGRAVP